MASLIRRIQAAFLGGADDEKLQALLAELNISSGSVVDNPLREARRGFMRSISDEAILRNALCSLELSGGGGGGAQAASDIRNAILLNLRDSETTLRQGLDGLLTPEDLGGGGGDVPDWVPANAKIHIDFLGGTPQGRAWSNGAEVAIDTLLGHDPNTENAYGPTGYNPAYLNAYGYDNSGTVAGGAPDIGFIGAARTTITAGCTIRFAFTIPVSEEGGLSYYIMSANGNDAVYFEGRAGAPNGIVFGSYNGDAEATVADCINSGGVGSNAIAITSTPSRAEFAANGGTVGSAVLTTSDWPPGALVAALASINGSPPAATQSITIYDPLPDTTGLSELSALG